MNPGNPKNLCNFMFLYHWKQISIIPAILITAANIFIYEKIHVFLKKNVAIQNHVMLWRLKSKILHREHVIPSLD